MQTNRINGSNLIDIVQGNHPALSLIPLDMHPASPNHRLEAGVVQFGYYGLIGPKPNEFLAATQFLTQSLQDQLTKGHMGIEVLTDSHEAIWLRAMLGLRLFQIRLVAGGGSHLDSSAKNLVNRLTTLTLQWFAHHASLLSLGYVPSGPLAGCILLPCARKRGAAKGDNREALSGVGTIKRQRQSRGGKGQAEAEKGSGKPAAGSMDPSELTRDVWYGEIASPGPTRATGASFWTLDKSRQDTASGPLYRLVEKEGGAWSYHFDVFDLPKLISPLEVVRYSNGHIAQFPVHPQLEDGVTYCAVEYSTGRFTFIEGEKEEGMSLGQEASRMDTP